MAKSVRQSVTVPAELAREIEQGAKRRHETFSKALVNYARLGIKEEEKTLRQLRAVFRKIRAAKSDSEAETYGEQLIEIMFGPQQEPRA